MPQFFVEDPEDNDTRNTITFDDAALRVSLSDNNRIVLDPASNLYITGIELISNTGSLVPLGNGTLNVQTYPFLEILVNSATRIVLTSEDWPLLLSDDLVTDIGWVPNASAQDLMVKYRVSGETGDFDAWVAEPLRLPFEDTTITVGNGSSSGPVRSSTEQDPDNPTTIFGTTRVIPDPNFEEFSPLPGAIRQFPNDRTNGSVDGFINP